MFRKLTTLYHGTLRKKFAEDPAFRRSRQLRVMCRLGAEIECAARMLEDYTPSAWMSYAARDSYVRSLLGASVQPQHGKDRESFLSASKRADRIEILYTYRREKKFGYTDDVVVMEVRWYDKGKGAPLDFTSFEFRAPQPVPA